MKYFFLIFLFAVNLLAVDRQPDHYERLMNDYHRIFGEEAEVKFLIHQRNPHLAREQVLAAAKEKYRHIDEGLPCGRQIIQELLLSSLSIIEQWALPK